MSEFVKNVTEFEFEEVVIKSNVPVLVDFYAVWCSPCRMQAPVLDEIASELAMTPEKVREIMKIAQDPVSLETPIGEEEDSHLGDFVEDNDSPAPSDSASYSLLREQLCNILNTLTPRESQVIKLRFGLEDGRPRTLEEVGKKFEITRERIRQIEAKALRKLRHPSRSKALKDYLAN